LREHDVAGFSVIKVAIRDSDRKRCQTAGGHLNGEKTQV